MGVSMPKHGLAMTAEMVERGDQDVQANAIFSSFWSPMVSKDCFTGRPPRRQ
jgi:hypothetical protein